MVKHVTIEGEKFFCYLDTLDDLGRLAPGYYVKDSELHRLLKLDDPVWPHRVQAALPLGRSVRNIVAVSQPDGETTVLETTTVELALAGPRWSADVIFAPSGKRREPVKMTLPFGRRPPGEAWDGA